MLSKLAILANLDPIFISKFFLVNCKGGAYKPRGQTRGGGGLLRIVEKPNFGSMGDSGISF